MAIRHHWNSLDECVRCGLRRHGLRRHGYQGGRTGSMTYVTHHGQTMSRAGDCPYPSSPSASGAPVAGGRSKWIEAYRRGK
jgi:hypothetical protein